MYYNYMEILLWCENRELCDCFVQNPELRIMTIQRSSIINPVFPIPGRPDHFYGGIHELARRRMLGNGINPSYLSNACRRDDFLLVAIERRDDLEIPIEDSFSTCKVLGVLAGKIHNLRCMEIDIIGSRTNHLGVGSTLMYHALNTGRNCGISVAMLKALPNAMSFYIKNNFTYLGTADLPVFVMDLLVDFNIQPRANMQRQNSAIIDPVVELKVEEIEQQHVFDETNAMEKGHYMNRDIPLDDYIQNISELGDGNSWMKMIESRVRCKGGHGYYVPSDHSAPYIPGRSDKAKGEKKWKKAKGIGGIV